jgi:hypothetical protein
MFLSPPRTDVNVENSLYKSYILIFFNITSTSEDECMPCRNSVESKQGHYVFN